MQRNRVSYSDVLIRFIEPIIDGTEDADTFMMKAYMGMCAWNYEVSDQNNLPINKEMKAAFKQLSILQSDGQKVVDALVLRKKMYFSQYDQFIFKVEKRVKPDNSVVLYVESCPADKLMR